jgi:hypothetical protein
MTKDDEEHMAGYVDGHDPTAPEPSANRSWCYRHSFAVGRRELERKPPVPAAAARELAAAAAEKDARS